jgi:hypothetical protein
LLEKMLLQLSFILIDMSWQSRTSPIQVGDKVCYSKRFLQSTGQYTGDIPFARGVVQELIPFGETMLAVIDWGDPNIPKRVNIANLTRVTTRGILE